MRGSRGEKLSLAELERLLDQNQSRPLGLQAIEPVVNVLGFNLALNRLSGGSTPIQSH